ncbi:hypothetical protein LTS03_004149 [Exophiala xenobiotica]|nr:hypothetical protein LTR41_000679 [Exophiala xenobiotica]KAK5352381.1 hypothetical protein LTR61_004632 [Exophiala xenobiotica]KAK5381309.1 hypothetical protein LTS03_004149 [Exophiala xenobiotica]KAK5418241.1 hypothetical protein LTR06_001990 [Exophiala xenobiotica]KAK5490060.1 hypothetical protein LTR55_004580 [Exophiala xenobiotica]
MGWIQSLFRPRQDYEPLQNGAERDDDSVEDEVEEGPTETAFSWLEYAIFFLLGIAMLWAWNMFLAAASYFQNRFRTSPWIVNHFQAAEISVSTVTNLTSMIVLTTLQKGASYPKRIAASLAINTVVFGILSISTLVRTPAGVYFGFLLLTIFVASFSTGLIQNGLFSFASGFGRSEYTQAIMTGQAVAGVLPPLAQIISVLAVPPKRGDGADSADASPTSALIYFLTATFISVISLLAFFYLLRRHPHHKSLDSAAKSTVDDTSEADVLTGNARARTDRTVDVEADEHPSVALTTLFLKMPFLAAAVFVCFTVTMVFPVFTVSIQSVSGVDPAIFVPTALLVWNLGDLLGRLATLWKPISLTHYPFALFCLAIARLLFIPLYFLCNIKGKGAVLSSDLFYLVIVQFLFGLTNGYLGSECMMGAGDWVAPEERPAAGGFMGLMLVSGLTVGSLLSFLLGDV